MYDGKVLDKTQGQKKKDFNSLFQNEVGLAEDDTPLVLSLFEEALSEKMAEARARRQGE